MLTLEIISRDTKISPDKIRSQGMIPAVYYGKKETSTPISIKAKDFIKAWKEAGESTVVILKDSKKELESLIHEVDLDPITDIPRHVDFYVFEKGKKLEVEVSIEFSGVSPAVKDLGGVLVKVLHDLKVEAEPKNLPHSILVDISSLTTLESVIMAKEIPLPEGVTLGVDPEEVVASIAVIKEEEEEPAEPIDLSKIEVEKKGKEDEEEVPPADGESQAK